MEEREVDIAGREDLIDLVRDFYNELMHDDILKHFFTEIRLIDLKTHIPVIADFWDNILFHTGAYKANAMEKHFILHDESPITKEHFDQWVKLFHKSVDAHFTGAKADMAKQRAKQIADLMAYQISHR